MKRLIAALLAILLVLPFSGALSETNWYVDYYYDDFWDMTNQQYATPYKGVPGFFSDPETYYGYLRAKLFVDMDSISFQLFKNDEYIPVKAAQPVDYTIRIKDEQGEIYSLSAQAPQNSDKVIISEKKDCALFIDLLKNNDLLKVIIDNNEESIRYILTISDNSGFEEAWDALVEASFGMWTIHHTDRAQVAYVANRYWIETTLTEKVDAEPETVRAYISFHEHYMIIIFQQKENNKWDYMYPNKTSTYSITVEATDASGASATVQGSWSIDNYHIFVPNLATAEIKKVFMNEGPISVTLKEEGIFKKKFSFKIEDAYGFCNALDAMERENSK